MLRACLTIGLLSSGLLAGGCTERSARLDSGGAVWPDAFLEASVGDGAVDGPAAVDSAAPDLLADGPGIVGDAPPPLGWTPVSISPAVTEDLHAVACVQGHVFIAGDNGTVLHWDPSAGPSFHKETVPTQTDLYTVSFADLSYGVVAGAGSQIWETRVSGVVPGQACSSDAECLDYSSCSTDLCDPGTGSCSNAWAPGCWSVAPQCSAYLFDVFYSLHLSAADKGFGAGVASNNQGAGAKYFYRSGAAYSWVCISPAFPTKIFYDTFRLGDVGWFVGDTNGEIYRGEYQTPITMAPVGAGTTQTLRGIHVVSAQLGVAVGEQGSIVRSTDGAGMVWTAVSSGVTDDLWDVFFWDQQTGWAVGEGGTILQTNNGGQTWQAAQSGAAVRLEGVCFTSATDGWAVGQNGTVLRTIAGGN